ncbi:hypothetical protein F8388_001069 [Cannabis sativa]|uniref:Uncharacterized protein n=1 Tax=Cannabis sativa TaxID=3483 RepID=A0A7J6E1N6_CANSA|nr:hypothetical protein F8388_001069 [Cannabis sativa]
MKESNDNLFIGTPSVFDRSSEKIKSLLVVGSKMGSKEECKSRRLELAGTPLKYSITNKEGSVQVGHCTPLLYLLLEKMALDKIRFGCLTD